VCAFAWSRPRSLGARLASSPDTGRLRRPATSSALGTCQLSAAQQGHYPTTPGKDNPKAVVVLPYYSSVPYYVSGIGRYVSGPAEMNASVVKTTTAVFDQEVGPWEVNITFTSAGSAEFSVRLSVAHTGQAD
jgi:hypothetical protein